MFRVKGVSMSIKKIKTPDGIEKWEVYFSLEGRGSQRIRRRFDRKIDAQHFLLDFKKRQEEMYRLNPEMSNPDEVTFDREFEFWQNNAETRFSAGHMKRVKGIMKIMLPRMGKMTLNKFTPTFLYSYQQELMQKGYSKNTVNRFTEVITAIINHSYRNQRIPYNPSVGFKKFPTSNIEMSFWKRSEAISFLEFASSEYPKGSKNRWAYVVYLLAVNTALRAGEIWGLKVCDIVEDGKTLFIRRQFNRVTKDFDLIKGKRNTKNGKTYRHVPCNKELLSELEAIIENEKLGPEDTIFRTSSGRPVCHDHFSDRFARDLKKWGGKEIRFHDLRHTAATLLIASGIDLKTVQEICGHENILTTMNYAHLIADNIKRVADLFSIAPEEKKKVLELHLVGARFLAVAHRLHILGF